MLRKPLSLELVKMAICLQGEKKMGQLGEIQGRAGRGACLRKLGTFEDSWDRQKLNATGKVILEKNVEDQQGLTWAEGSS